MTNFENEHRSDENIDIGDFGFSWEDGIEIEQFTPVDEALIEEASVPVRQPKTLIGELTADFQSRLEIMRVEDPKAATIWRVRRFEKLYWYLRPYSLEDVHYAAYDRVRRESQVPYISVNYWNLIREMPDNEAQLDVLQRKQTTDAYGCLVDLGINHNELKKLDRGSDEDRYLLRSLHRLLQEPYLADFMKKITDESPNRDKGPIGFAEVAARATRIIQRKYEFHMNHDLQTGGSDARMWHELERRSLERARSFAKPLIGRLPDNSR